MNQCENSKEKKHRLTPLTIAPRSFGKRRIRYDLLEGWYGKERAGVEIAAHTCQPSSVASVIDEALKELDKRNSNGALTMLHSQWEKIIGRSFAAYTAPKALKDGKLLLEVRHSAIIPELSMSKDLFIRAVNRFCPCTDIIFTVGSSRKKQS